MRKIKSQHRTRIFSGDLRRMRLTAQKTTSEMADAADVSTRKTYENWEAGRSAPDINQFLNMLVEFGYDIEPIVELTRLPPEIANQVLRSLSANMDIIIKQQAHSDKPYGDNVHLFTRPCPSTNENWEIRAKK